MKCRNVSVLGSTGSIGVQTLDVLREHRDIGRVVALCARSNVELLSAQANEFHPELVCIEDSEAAKRISLPKGTELYVGHDAAVIAATYESVDTVVNGVSGFEGMRPLIAALELGRTVALANKESIVCAGRLAHEAATRGGGKIIPVDSEQSAIYQCLSAGRREDVKRLILTASGGPFREYTKEMLARVTPQEASHHPTWRMGRKITLDSATLFNKGLEVIEAARLFDFGADEISVVVHPESVVHSMVEFKDSSVIAQLSAPDMRLAILYSLTVPERIESAFGALDLAATGKLTFFEPDVERFPAIRLAYGALRASGACPAIYNGANEAAAELFLSGFIAFTEIAELVEETLNAVCGCSEEKLSMEAVIEADSEARRFVFKRFKERA